MKWGFEEKVVVLSGLVYIFIYTKREGTAMNPEQQDIVQRQKALLEEMGRIHMMRRGVVSEQRYAQRRERRDGQGACGPYFVWQGYVDGKRFSTRASAQDAATMKAEIEARRRFERLCAEYIALGEALAEHQRKQSVSEEGLKKGLTSRSNKARKLRE